MKIKRKSRVLETILSRYIKTKNSKKIKVKALVDPKYTYTGIDE